MFNRYLTTLSGIRYFMISFGLFMGIIFPFYSMLFFGIDAFNPLYIAGCLLAGLFVGLFCSYIIKRSLQLQLEQQVSMASRFTGSNVQDCRNAGKDELESLRICHEMLLDQAISMLDNLIVMTDEFSIKFRELEITAKQIFEGNENQIDKEEQNLKAVYEMKAFLNTVRSEIEELAARSEEHSDIGTKINAATDSISENIKEYSNTVFSTSASIEEMAANIKEISGNIEALAESTEQTSSSIQQISLAVNNVRDNTQKAVESAVNVRMLAQDGMRGMNATQKAMQEIEQSYEESYAAISRLSVHSARVGEFLKVIHEVVEQTNLLSLNASIIAAQAGERGKAFSVVAEEVRSLAHRTSASTVEIQELVKNIQKETAAVQRSIAQGKDRGKSGVKISALTSGALVKIEETTTEVAQMIQRIAASTVKQASGSRIISEEANKNLERVQQITKSIKEHERGTINIVAALESMRNLSAQVISATEEQSHGNHEYIRSILEDNERMKKLKEKAGKQIELAERLNSCMGESGILLQKNMANARHIMDQIKSISVTTDRIKEETSPYSVKAPIPAQDLQA